jgi:hypothetical protein
LHRGDSKPKTATSGLPIHVTIAAHAPKLESIKNINELLAIKPIFHGFWASDWSCLEKHQWALLGVRRFSGRYSLCHRRPSTV